MKRIRSFLANDNGMAVTEYGLLLALIAVAVVAVVKAYGPQLSASFSSAASSISTP
jgi:pilus assembly protein Flp/PilA